VVRQISIGAASNGRRTLKKKRRRPACRRCGLLIVGKPPFEIIAGHLTAAIFSLPEDVDQDGMKAAFKKGVLTVTLPRKALPASDAKQIEVKSG